MKRSPAAPDRDQPGATKRPRGIPLAAIAAGTIALARLLRVPAAAAEPDDARVATLIDRLKQGEFEERRRAADALGDLGPAAARAVPALVAALQDEHVEVHWYALDALGRIGRAPASAVPALTAELTNPRTNRYSRRVAARALGRFGHEAAAAAPAAPGRSAGRG